MSQMMEPRSRDLRMVLAWLKRSNWRSRGSCLLEKTLPCSAVSCWQYSARTRSLMSGEEDAQRLRSGGLEGSAGAGGQRRGGTPRSSPGRVLSRSP